MKNPTLIPSLYSISVSLLVLIGLSGCQNNGETQLLETYPNNCLWYGIEYVSTGPVSGPPEPISRGDELQIPAEFSYGLPLEINPDNPNQVLVGKAIWNEVNQTTSHKLVILDLQTQEETTLLELQPFNNPQAEGWGDFRWGEGGWIVAEKYNDKQLYLFHPDSASPRRLTNPASGAYHNPSWVAEGREIFSLGYGPQGQDMLWRIIDLQGTVKHEFFLNNLPAGFVRNHQFADWRKDSLLVSAGSIDGNLHLLSIFSYPEMKLLKHHRVVDPSSNSIISDHEWWPGTERILWTIHGGLYATDWRTGQTEPLWENCEQLLQGFAVLPDGDRVLCLFNERVIREDLGGTQNSFHIYMFNLSSRTLTRLK